MTPLFTGKIAPKMSEEELMEMKENMNQGINDKKFINFTADEITRNVVRAVMPSFILVGPCTR